MEAFSSAVFCAKFKADFPSSGFGNGTVGKVGSGSAKKSLDYFPNSIYENYRNKRGRLNS